MLIDYIERLRKEPKEVRRQAALFWSVVIIVGIVALYIGILLLKNTLPERGPTDTIAAPYESTVE